MTITKNSSITFNKHTKTVHEGRRDYKCVFCDSFYSQAGHLKIHISAVHELDNKNHKCSSCQKSFSSSQYLKLHTRTVHEGHKDY